MDKKILISCQLTSSDANLDHPVKVDKDESDLFIESMFSSMENYHARGIK